mmetsp:Transcript_38908/g.97740  ORF Transcript_38908/g.97740 Transcript_38908/m.97740 type:complete len:206 (+) Transcript_38908:271-888(+)
MRCSSAAGVAFLSVSSASLAPSPMVPPTKIFTPSTPFPSSLAAAPISPMSPTCACPHELGHPVQFKRTILGMSSCFSSSAATWMARFFVSTIPKPQNWEPVQDTSPREMLPAEHSAESGSKHESRNTNKCWCLIDKHRMKHPASCAPLRYGRTVHQAAVARMDKVCMQDGEGVCKGGAGGCRTHQGCSGTLHIWARPGRLQHRRP